MHLFLDRQPDNNTPTASYAVHNIVVIFWGVVNNNNVIFTERLNSKLNLKKIHSFFWVSRIIVKHWGLDCTFFYEERKPLKYLVFFWLFTLLKGLENKLTSNQQSVVFQSRTMAGGRSRVEVVLEESVRNGFIHGEAEDSCVGLLIGAVSWCHMLNSCFLFIP